MPMRGEKNAMHAVRRGAMLASVLALAAGCASGGTPTRDVHKVSNEVAAVATGLKSLARLDGRTAGNVPPAKPFVGLCDDKTSERNVSQAWTVYAGDEALKAAMDRLVMGLPGQGWTVLQKGFDPSETKDYDVKAVYKASGLTLDATWFQARPITKSMMTFTIGSGCFRLSTSV